MLNYILYKIVRIDEFNKRFSENLGNITKWIKFFKKDILTPKKN